MKTSIFKSILIGILIGILFFVATKIMLILLIIGAIFKLSGKGKWNRGKWKEKRMSFLDDIRRMNDDEFNKFNETFMTNKRSSRRINLKNA